MGEHWRLAGVGTGILLLILLLRQGEQFPHRGQVLGAPSVGEQSVVADAVEAGRQDVYEEAADELVCCQGHDLAAPAALDPVVLPGKGDAPVIEADQAAVGDGDAVGVAAEIGEHRLGAGEGALGVDHPFDLA